MKRCSLLVLLLAVFGFVACEPDNPMPDQQNSLVLSADVNHITADGLSVATFTVKRDGATVTDKCHIYNVESGEPLSGNYFTSTEKGRYSFYAMYGTEKSNTIEIEVLAVGETPAEKIAVLSVSKNEIISNGSDAAIFVVKVDNEDVTNDAKIYMENSDKPLAGNSFTTTEEGTYSFFAEVEGAKRSELVTVVATAEPVVEEKPIELSASVESIRANGVDAVAFTVKQEGNIVTDACTIYVGDSKLNGSRFSTFTAGTYTFYAVKGNATSNEVVVTAEVVTETGTTIVFADGVSLNAGWYDVNKVGMGDNGDSMMCWAAVSSNLIQWWQDHYVAAGNTLPSGAVNGIDATGTYELELMQMFHSEWNNTWGGHVNEAIPWYFEGVLNGGEYASAGTQAVPLTEGGYWKDIWAEVLPHMYHDYDYILIPDVAEYHDLYTVSYNNYYTWGNGSDLLGVERLKKFSDIVVETFSRGAASLTVAEAANLGSNHHAVTLWGYEIDNATGLLSRVWITDSDDLTTEPKTQLLNEYSVSIADGKSHIKFTGNTRYGALYVVAIVPFSGYQK